MLKKTKTREKVLRLLEVSNTPVSANEIYEVLEKFGYREVGNEYLQGTLEASSKDMSNYDKGRMYFYLEDFESARNYLELCKKYKVDIVLRCSLHYAKFDTQ